ncbi:MAG: radical SAM protein [Oscillospiraceae bacterium]|nr:radical SAM protein [Oscillospiraceae bacterium]
MELYCVEMHLSDVCNLNCRGCTHFANIEKEPNFPTLEEFGKDLRRLNALFDGIKMLRVMGGEPLKNPRFLEYLQLAREILPETKIWLVSNGLLLPEVTGEAMQTMAELDIRFNISLYPPTMEILEKLEAKMNAYGIRYCFTKPITHFRKRIDLTASNDAKENFATCIFKDYTFLYHGRFAVCSAPILVEKFNKAFHRSLRTGEDVVEIHDPKVDKAYMEKYMHSHKNCCSYCGEPVEFPWSNQGTPEITDWIVR